MKKVWTYAKLTFLFVTSMFLLDSGSPLAVGHAQTTTPKCNTSSSCYSSFFGGRCYCSATNCTGCFIPNASTTCGTCSGGASGS